MTQIFKTKESAPDQWALINRILIVYKVAALGLAATTLLMGALAFYHSTASPIVVIQQCGEKFFAKGNREKPKITDDDLKRFIENWISLRYNWNEFDPEKIIQSIAPISTGGFQAKLSEILGKKKSENTKDQRI